MFFQHTSLKIGLAVAFLLCVLVFGFGCGKKETTNKETAPHTEPVTEASATEPTTENVKEPTPQNKTENTNSSQNPSKETETSFVSENHVRFLSSSLTFDKETTEVLEIPYEVSKGTVLSIEIYNAENVKIYTILQDVVHSEGKYTETWDGCNLRGEPFKNGEYTIRMQGDFVTQEAKIELYNLKKPILATLNAKTFYETQGMHLQYTLKEAGPLDIRIYDENQEEVATLFETAHQDLGEYALDFNMPTQKDSFLKAGQYTLCLSSVHAVEKIPFEILPKTLVDRISAIADLESPQPTMQIDYSVIFDAEATVSIYNEEGICIKTLLQNQPLHPGDFALLWDLTDETGARVENGNYSVHFDFKAPNFETHKTVSCMVQLEQADKEENSSNSFGI